MKVVGVVAIAAATFHVPCLAEAGGGPNRHRGRSSWLTTTLDSIRPLFMAARRPGGDNKLMSMHNNNDVILTTKEGWGLLDGFPKEDLHHRSLEFGDYVDPSFSCPAMVTCNIVCVANITDCPADALCPGTHPDNVANSNHTYEVRENNRDHLFMHAFIYCNFFSQRQPHAAVCRRNVRRYNRRTSMRHRGCIAMLLRGSPPRMCEASGRIAQLFRTISTAV